MTKRREHRMPFRDRVEITFDAGHRLLNYPGKCASPHGHTFRAEIIIEGDSLDPLGLVMDFGDIKRAIKAWIDDHWDHGFLVNSEDDELINALAAVAEAKVYKFAGVNPSAEAMARELFSVARGMLGTRLAAVRIWESKSQYAEFLK